MLFGSLFLFLNNLQLISIISIVLFSSNISFRILHPLSFKELSNFYFLLYEKNTLNTYKFTWILISILLIL
jgi:hypothetical protein